MTSLKRFFFWLAAAGTETLEQCPAWEQRKYVALGATVLVPTLFGFIACAYALSTVTDNPRVIYPVAAVWGFIILTIDRALISGYRAYLSVFRKLSQFSLRIVVALLLGVTIAHPLVLLLFRDTVSAVIEKDRAADIEATRATYTVEKDRAGARIAAVEEQLAEQRRLWNESFQVRFIVQDETEAPDAIPGLTPEQQAELKEKVSESAAPFRDRLAVVDGQLDELSPLFAKTQQELTFWQAEFERELNGQRSGLVGEGPRARSIRSDNLEPRRQEAKRLSGMLEHLAAEKTTLQTQIREAEAAAVAEFELKLAEINSANKAEAERVAALKHRVEETQADGFVTQQNALRETIKAQIDTRMADLTRAQDELAAIVSQEAAAIGGLRAEPRSDILTQTLALHSMFSAGSESGRFALYTYCLLASLFMLVDTIPLVIKFFTKAGPYDTLVDRDEITYDAEHRAFRASRHRYMENLAGTNLISVTRNKSLEHALVDGVEHSRAAREFLDSLMEMERAFAEKMKLEEELIGVADLEKRSAHEEIKRRFYEHLHQRMEVFFRQHPAQ